MRRGDIYLVQLPKNWEYSHVQQGTRPVIVLTSQYGLDTSDIATVAAITSHNKDLPINVPVSLSRPSQILCNQIFTVPQELLKAGVYITTCDEATLQAVAQGIFIALDLVPSNRDTIEEARIIMQKLKVMIDTLSLSERKYALYNERVHMTTSELQELTDEWDNARTPGDREEIARKWGFKNKAAASNRICRFRKVQYGS